MSKEDKLKLKDYVKVSSVSGVSPLSQTRHTRHFYIIFNLADICWLYQAGLYVAKLGMKTRKCI